MIERPKILFVCGASPSYPSNRIKYRILKKRHQTTLLASKQNSFPLRFLSIFLRLPFLMYSHDIFFVGWMGHPIVPFLRLFTKKPIIFDLQTELHDGACVDRKLFMHGSWRCRVVWWLDRQAHTKSTVIVVHDPIHADRIHETFGTPRDRFVEIPMCADRTIFYPRVQEKLPADKDKFVVEFCGEISPVHGIDVVLRAAKQLEDTNIIFRIAGKGQLSSVIEKLHRELKLSNVELISRRLSDEEMITQRKDADLCLGMFGDTPKARRNLLNKSFETIAMGQPFLTAGPPEVSVVEHFFHDGETAFFCRINDPNALAEKILWIRDHADIREHVMHEGHKLFERLCSEDAMSQRVYSAIAKTAQG
mgnify:CR=1 FL=1